MPETETNGVPVLLLHTFASNGAADWPDGGLPAALLTEGRPVYVPDLPGHGGNPRPGSAASVSTDQQVAALAALISSMPGDRVDIVGYSLGARLAWSLALASPRPVGHLVLGGLSPFEPFGALNMEELQALVRDGAKPQDPLTEMIGAMITGPGGDPASLFSVVEGLRAGPFQPQSSAPAVPTLFVRGTEDRISAGIENLAEAVKGAELVSLPGGHIEVLHNPAFHQAAVEFLTN